VNPGFDGRHWRLTYPWRLLSTEISTVPHRNVAAERGIRWISDAAQLIRANPAPFLLMGLAIGVLAILPLLGALALAVFGPALYAGIVFAASEQAAGRPADIQHLLRGFQQPGKLPRLVMLCLPGVAAGLLVAIVAVVVIGSALAAAGAPPPSGNQPLDLPELGAAGPLFVLVAIVIAVVAYAAVFFAIPRVMLTDVDALTAIGDSLRACRANLGAFGLYVATMIVVVLLVSAVASLLLGWLSILLAQMVTMALTVPIFSSAMYIAWRDVFCAADSGEAPPPSGIEA
jgi:hypothetical protein